MRILEDDLSCGQFRLEYQGGETMTFQELNHFLLHSFFLFAEDFFVPYSLNLEFYTFEAEYWWVEDEISCHHLHLDKAHIHTSPHRNSAQTQLVPELSLASLSQLYAEIVAANPEKHPGIHGISCYSGLYYLPEKTSDQEFTLYIGPGGGRFDRQRPIYQGIGIEAPLKTHKDIWAPIEVVFGQDMGNLTLNVYLNWDLYGHHHASGFAMLNAAFDKLITRAWTRS